MNEGTSEPPAVQPPSEPRANTPDRRILFLLFFFAAYFYLLYELARILSPFFGALFGALMLVIIFYPVHRRIERTLRRPNLAAALTTLLVLVTIVVPIIALVWLLVHEATDVVPWVREWLAEKRQDVVIGGVAYLPAPLARSWEAVRSLVDAWNVDLRQTALDAVSELGNAATALGAATLRGLLGLLFNIIVLVIALFFFLRDGTEIVRWVLDLVPMEETNKQLVLRQLDRTLSAIIRGAFITSSAQGLLTGVGLAIAGVPFPVLLGFAAALACLVPFVGPALVWMPAAAYLFATGSTSAAIGLFVWGVLVVGLVDNFLRPYVIGEHAHLPILLLLIGVLGGLQTYGLIGVLLSPLIIATVLAFARIYREQYLEARH